MRLDERRSFERGDSSCADQPPGETLTWTRAILIRRRLKESLSIRLVGRETEEEEEAATLELKMKNVKKNTTTEEVKVMRASFDNDDRDATTSETASHAKEQRSTTKWQPELELEIHNSQENQDETSTSSRTKRTRLKFLPADGPPATSKAASLLFQLKNEYLLSWFSLLKFLLLFSTAVQVSNGLRITSFRVPPFVPITLPVGHQPSQTSSSPTNELDVHRLELTKPLLLDCDYSYEPELDDKLTVKWFRNEEAEPFYQWLPQLNQTRHFADWIRPLVDQEFVSDLHDPLKRFRSLLIRRLSLNLTGQYTCLVSSLAGENSRRSSLIVYKPPRAFSFEHSLFPARATLVARGGGEAASSLRQLKSAPSHHSNQNNMLVNQLDSSKQAHNMIRNYTNQIQMSQATTTPLLEPPAQLGRPSLGPIQQHKQHSPTQFKNLTQQHHHHHQHQAHLIVRPANNNPSPASAGQQQAEQPEAANGSQRIVYTHDGRPVTRRPRQLVSPPVPSFTMQQTRAGFPAPRAGHQAASGHQLQLLQLQCQASQVMPLPLMLLTVRRDAESIAQYLHEASTTSVRSYSIQNDLLEAAINKPNQQQLIAQAAVPGATAANQTHMSTLYDVRVSATVVLNVSLPIAHQGNQNLINNREGPESTASADSDSVLLASGIQTILPYKRNQRMSFECQLVLTGTDFDQRKRINIEEKEIYQFAEASEDQTAGGTRQQNMNEPAFNLDTRLPHSSRTGQPASSWLRGRANNSSSGQRQRPQWAAILAQLMWSLLFAPWSRHVLIS